MQEANEKRDELIREFSENYMEKLFYFCLKKTGKAIEAEDLTQDIALQILAALNKGTLPTNFSAWVWQIARNRYSVWAKEKHDRNESVTGSDIADYELPDESDNILDDMIHIEQMALLRRELAFIKGEYRNIIVAYYIENKSVRDIALQASLSVSAVQQRLHRARIILKEGMNMAREFGKRSYNPEDIIFAASGSQPSGLPWSAVQRKISQNILLQASNNPSTLEELSMELGIALPYMEEEVDLLHRATLLEKQGDKYITNFFILDKNCRESIYHALRNGSRERSLLIREFIEDKMSDIRALDIAEKQIDDNTIRWWLIPYLSDRLIENGIQNGDPPKRANGETWGFVGYEAVEIPESIAMGQNGCVVGKNEFWSYKYSDYSMWDQCGEPENSEVKLMLNCIAKNRRIDSFSDMEKELWKGVNGRYAHASDDGYVIPDVLVLTTEKLQMLEKLFRDHKNYDLLKKNIAEAYDSTKSILEKYSHQVLHKNMNYNIRMEMYSIRMMSVHDLVDEGFLKIPADTRKSSLGMYIILK